MSGQNVESSQRVWERFLAGDTAGVLAFFDPEVEVHDPPELPDAGVYHGHQGWLEQIENFKQAFSELSYEPLEFIDAGERVVDVINARGVAKIGGLEAEVTYAQIDTWREGKVVKIQYFSSREAALAAAGLEG
jgi:ketosteroid isomerase-like protein